MAIIEIDVWMWPLMLSEAAAVERAQLLSVDEVARAARFVAAADQRSYIAGRSRLRELLGRYVGQSATDLRFAYNSAGKPDLVSDGPKISFNLSHSDGLAALAVTAHHSVGIDVEGVRPIHENIAERFFSATETHAIASLPQSERPAAFFRCWTRKEAFVKAVGDGLNYPLATFSVSVAEEAISVVAHIDGPDGDQASLWRLVNFTPRPGMVGAIALRADAIADHVSVRFCS